MAFEPINYTQQVADPFAQAVQGFQVGDAIRQRQMAQQQAMQEQQRQQAAQAEVQGILSNPNATPEDRQRAVMLLPPQVSAQMQNIWKSVDEKQAQSALSFEGKVYSTLESGRSDLAAQLLNDRAQALENSGRKQEAAQFRAQAEEVTSNPVQARNLSAMRIDAMPGGKTFWEARKERGIEDRAQTDAPLETRKKAAEATKAEGDATITTEKAKVAAQAVALDLKQATANLGLTSAQEKEALARTAKLQAETQQAIADAAKGGSPEKRFEAEQKLRKEYADQTKGFVDVTEAYRRVKAASDDGPGDIALIYSYMKMLDPGSVVREGEFATAQNSGGIPTAISNLYNKALSGARLSDSQRKTFIGQAGKLASAAGKREEEVRQGLTGVVQTYGLNPANVFGSAVKKDPADAWAAGGAKPPPTKTGSGVTVSGW